MVAQDFALSPAQQFSSKLIAPRAFVEPFLSLLDLQDSLIVFKTEISFDLTRFIKGLIFVLLLLLFLIFPLTNLDVILMRGALFSFFICILELLRAR